MTYVEWLREFTEEAERRAGRSEPDWAVRVRMHPDVVRSVQRFQVGEDGDGRNLIGKAEGAGDAAYAAAVRLFVQEEREHARMLGELLRAAGASTIATHWSDVVFIWLRRGLGLRLELMVLAIAEVVALVYYRVLRDGAGDALTSEVAGRILADERRHVPFHRDRLRAAPVSRAARVVWWWLFLGAVLVVVGDHGRALRVLGVSRRAFVAEAVREFAVASDLRVRDLGG
ncbi:ferritin-like domain-containing protein [Actinokineospora iranica]|uniref:Ferritin-like domain-containing protein n=1 Tax=Actinokineospora iranica TaxID=1271860 RepID=A0A1G6LVF5_9PSEU|nr:ferritin-like domain-containing protein [Actinokineospora iranica]SDC46725.1 hypothetical protein SAMN05216174_102241 [Actinokineospora iranica]